jgi:hypothetical protein
MIHPDTSTPPLIVQSFPPDNLYWEIIGEVDKGCQSGIVKCTVKEPTIETFQKNANMRLLFMFEWSAQHREPMYEKV